MKFGILTAPTIGHIFPLISLSKELQARGHEVTFFNVEDVKEWISKENIGFESVGSGFIPKGAISTLQSFIKSGYGFNAMQIWQAYNIKLTKLLFAFLPKKIQSKNIDFLLVDQSDAAGGSVAEFLRIPYITIVVGNNLKMEDSIPPVFTNWSYRDNIASYRRNQEANKRIIKEFSPLRAVINHYRNIFKLAEYASLTDIFPCSDIAEIAQLPSFLDLPRKEKKDSFYNVGPFVSQNESFVSFPYDRLNGKPLIYASLGTIVNQRMEIFSTIASACAGLDVQLVISLGTTQIPADFPMLEGSPIVLPFVPQREILKRASLCITHAGLNTVLDALKYAVPLIAIPISFDQPGTATRIKFHHLGEVLKVESFRDSVFVKKVIENLLSDAEIKNNATSFSDKLATLNPIGMAVDIIESKFK